MGTCPALEELITAGTLIARPNDDALPIEDGEHRLIPAEADETRQERSDDTEPVGCDDDAREQNHEGEQVHEHQRPDQAMGSGTAVLMASS